MLLANEYAAKTITLYFPETAMLRKHVGLNVTDVIKTLNKLTTIVKDTKLLSLIREVSHVIATNSSGNLNLLLDQHCSVEMKIFFSNLLSMNMSPALYTYPDASDTDERGLRHFALNLDLYWVLEGCSFQKKKEQSQKLFLES